MALPQILEQWKTDNGLTDDDAAARFNVKPSTFTRWRRGMQPRQTNVPKIAEVLGLTDDEVTVARSRSLALVDRVEALERQLAELSRNEQARRSGSSGS